MSKKERLENYLQQRAEERKAVINSKGTLEQTKKVFIELLEKYNDLKERYKHSKELDVFKLVKTDMNKVKKGDKILLMSKDGLAIDCHNGQIIFEATQNAKLDKNNKQYNKKGEWSVEVKDSGE